MCKNSALVALKSVISFRVLLPTAAYLGVSSLDVDPRSVCVIVFPIVRPSHSTGTETKVFIKSIIYFFPIFSVY